MEFFPIRLTNLLFCSCLEVITTKFLIIDVELTLELIEIVVLCELLISHWIYGVSNAPIVRKFSVPGVAYVYFAVVAYNIVNKISAFYPQLNSKKK